MRITSFIPLLLAAWSTAAFAQQVAFEHLSLSNGLSQSSVYAIAQDSLGFIWFGTQDGLDRYDGYSFNVFRNDPVDSTSLSGNYVIRLMVDGAGTLWVGTAGDGLSSYDQVTGRFTQYLHKSNDRASLSNNDIHAIYQDSEGKIWIGTVAGLNLFEPKTGSFKSFFFHISGADSIRSNYISSIFEDKDHRFWIGSLDGAGILDRNNGTFTKVQSDNIVINKILQLQDGTVLFIGAGVYSYDSPQNRLIPWKKRLTDEIEKNIGSEGAVLNGDGTVWLSSYEGLGLIGTKTDTVAVFRNNPSDPGSLSENSILSLCRDRSGILWVGTYAGINKFVPTKKKFDYYSPNPKDLNSLSNPRVRSFAEDANGMIWIATQGGLDRFDPKSVRFANYTQTNSNPYQLTSNTFWSVIVDQTTKGTSVWAGTNGGGIDILHFPENRSYTRPVVKNFRLSTQEYRALFSNVINSLYHDRSGNIWAGHDYGVTELIRNGPGYIERPFPFPSNVNCIFQDSDGAIWIGGYSLPLQKLDPERNKFFPVFTDSGFTMTLAAKSVLSMAESSDSTLWVGTYGGLLHLTGSGNLIRVVTVRDGLPNNVIYAILKDHYGNLWMSMDMGLCRYSPVTGVIKNYTESDGLQSNEFNQGSAFESSDGKFYFGGINGFNSFYPDSIHDNPNVPKVVFTDFKIFNKSAAPSSSGRKQTIWTARSVDLNYSDAVLTFDFAALEFTDPERNKYAYKLDGFDKNWQSLGSKREVTYTNLDPGKYVLHVIASNNDGVWNNEGTSLVIYISPPWWMTWWFRAAAILTFLSIGPAVYYRRVTALKKETALQREFSGRLIESQESERGRIAAELHDTIGQDLLVIKNRAYLANQSKRITPRVKEQLDKISETVTQSLQNVREIVRNLRPYQLERIGLTGSLKSMLDSVGSISTKSGHAPYIKLEVSLENIDGLLSDHSREREMSFFRIVQESVNNVMKHSGAASASVTVKRESGRIIATIHDDGKGFDYDTELINRQRAGFGLSGMKERTRILGGSLTVVSGIGKGTTVTLVVPVDETQNQRNEIN